MADQLIPLDSSPNQKFAVALAVDGNTVRLQLSITYSGMAGYWMLAVATDDGIMLLDAVPLITGTWPAANVLAQYAYLGIGSAYVVSAGIAADDYPESDDLGSDWLLLWCDTVLPPSASTATEASGATFTSLAAVGSGMVAI